MTQRFTFIIPAVLLTALMVVPAIAQQGAASSGDVLMLEEIRIEVAPELPTVVVTIPRQKPVISSVVLKKDPEELIRANPGAVKPRLSDLVVNKIEEPQKMLAKERSQ